MGCFQIHHDRRVEQPQLETGEGVAAPRFSRAKMTLAYFCGLENAVVFIWVQA